MKENKQQAHGVTPVAMIPSEPSRLVSRPSFSADDLSDPIPNDPEETTVDPLDHGENLPEDARDNQVVKPSEPSRLNDEHGIQVTTNDLISSENPIEPCCLSSRFSSLDGDLFEHDDHGITPVSIPSDAAADASIPLALPAKISAHLSSSTGDSHGLAFFGLAAEHGIPVGTDDSLLTDPESTMDPFEGV